MEEKTFSKLQGQHTQIHLKPKLPKFSIVPYKEVKKPVKLIFKVKLKLPPTRRQELPKRVL